MTGFDNWLRANPVKAVIGAFALIILGPAASQTLGGAVGFVMGWLLQGAGIVLLALLLRLWLRGRDQ